MTFNLRNYGGVVDEVLLEVTQFDNLDLYYHLTNKNLVSHIYGNRFPHVNFLRKKKSY